MENRKVGAIWEKEGANGKFYSGELLINGRKIKIVLFKNKDKQGNQPDWDILVAREREIGIEVPPIDKEVEPVDKGLEVDF
jgi:hypothetical protein